MKIKGNTDGDYIIDNLDDNTIKFINTIDENRYIILKNLKGITSSTLEKITNPNIRISLVSGLNYQEKEKYNSREYKERTYYKPEELKEIVKYFESIEKEISPNWSELQKTMYIYDCIMMDTKYVTYFKDKDIEGLNNALRTLTGNLYHELTCAGIALTFKVLMERQGIECFYQNQRSSHSFNTIKINGKYYGVDLTWDLSKYEQLKEKRFEYQYFGREKTNDFYKGYHSIAEDSEEKVFELSIFSKEEIQKNHAVINEKISSRKKHQPQALDYSLEEKKRILGNKQMYHYIQEEYRMILILKELKSRNLIKENTIYQKFYQIRYPIVADLCDDKFFISISKNTIFGKDISSQELFTILDNFFIKYINNFFMDSEIYVKACNFNKHDDIYVDAMKKIEFLLENKEYVVKLGYQEELKYFEYIYNKKNKEDLEEKMKEEITQYELDKDFFIGCMNTEDIDSTKKIIESELQKELSNEEFKFYFTNIQFMKKRFPSLSKYQFSDNEYENILRECFALYFEKKARKK